MSTVCEDMEEWRGYDARLRLCDVLRLGVRGVQCLIEDTATSSDDIRPLMDGVRSELQAIETLWEEEAEKVALSVASRASANPCGVVRNVLTNWNNGRWCTAASMEGSVDGEEVAAYILDSIAEVSVDLQKLTSDELFGDVMLVWIILRDDWSSLLILSSVGDCS